jgi:hypothetical protein
MAICVFVGWWCSGSGSGRLRDEQEEGEERK